jgi:hypothetical protein
VVGVSVSDIGWDDPVGEVGLVAIALLGNFTERRRLSLYKRVM